MYRKGLFIIILVLTTAFALAVPGSALAGKSYHAERFDVNLDIQEDGSLWVVETIAFKFEGGPFTYVFRDLSTTRTDGIAEISASLDGQPLPVGSGIGHVEIIRGNPIKIRWNFAPTTNASRTYTLRYHVLGVVRKLDTDTLIWRAVPESHEYTIDSSTITLQYPSVAALLDHPTTGKIPSFIQSGDSYVRLVVSGIADDTPVDVTVHFRAGSITSAIPNWQASDALRGRLIRQAIPYGVTIGFLVLLGGVLSLAFWDRNHRRQETNIYSSPFHPTTPPGPEAPGIAAALVNARRGSIAANPLATLFDLARRGIVQIEEHQKQVLWMRQSEFSITLQPISSPLSSHERELLSIIFETKKGPRTSASFSELAAVLSSNPRRFTEVIKQELDTAGYLDPRREKQRSILMVSSIPLMILGILMLASGLMWTSLAGDASSTQSLILPMVVAFSGFSFLILGIVILFYGASRSPLTDQADVVASNWKGFFEYLKEITRGNEAPLRPDIFDYYLPFAASAGMLEIWGKFFAKTGMAQVPAWFQPLNESNSDFGSFNAMLSASNSTTGADGGAAAGAGASGGGASGAG